MRTDRNCAYKSHHERRIDRERKREKIDNHGKWREKNQDDRVDYQFRFHAHPQYLIVRTITNRLLSERMGTGDTVKQSMWGLIGGSAEDIPSRTKPEGKSGVNKTSTRRSMRRNYGLCPNDHMRVAMVDVSDSEFAFPKSRNSQKKRVDKQGETLYGTVCLLSNLGLYRFAIRHQLPSRQKEIRKTRPIISSYMLKRLQSKNGAAIFR